MRPPESALRSGRLDELGGARVLALRMFKALGVRLPSPPPWDEGKHQKVPPLARRKAAESVGCTWEAAGKHLGGTWGSWGQPVALGSSCYWGPPGGEGRAKPREGKLAASALYGAFWQQPCRQPESSAPISTERLGARTSLPFQCSPFGVANIFPKLLTNPVNEHPYGPQDPL